MRLPTWSRRDGVALLSCLQPLEGGGGTIAMDHCLRYLHWEAELVELSN